MLSSRRLCVNAKVQKEFERLTKHSFLKWSKTKLKNEIIKWSENFRSIADCLYDYGLTGKDLKILMKDDGGIDDLMEMLRDEAKMTKFQQRLLSHRLKEVFDC